MPSADFQAHPIFKRGAAPRARLLIYVMICLTMLVVDLRFRYLEIVRQGLSVVTYPMQLAAAEPSKMVRDASEYFTSLAQVQLENADLRRRQLDVAERLLRFEQLEQENASLRGLLDMAKRVRTYSVAAEVLYPAPDPFSLKVVLDRGKEEVELGQAVVDADGVIGQITRVYPIQSEVTLITDRNQAVPVQVERNGQRGVVFGTGKGGLELRFVLANADIRVGDRLVTSGLDGALVPGLPVAVVESVDRSNTDAFARIACQPLGGVSQSVRVLVLSRAELPPPPPKPETGDPPPPQAPVVRRDSRGGD
jgi:rod shape-determining protein MreC